MNSSLQTAKDLDAADPLAWTRGEFILPDGIIYLDGNSLGALPKKAVTRIEQIVREEWGQGLVSSWGTANWLSKPTEVGDRVGKLIGAATGQTIVADSISVNLFKLVCAALEMQAGRRTLVSEASNFPSDLYVLQGLERLWPGVSVKLIGRDGTFDELVDGDTAAVILTEVDFRTGAQHDMRTVTEKVQQAGALMVWDLAHSAGAVPVDLDGCNADMAVGCTYKYLNAGPGAPGFLYLAKRHQHEARTPIAGWFGHKDPFAFDVDYAPAPDIRQFLAGTPPIVSYGALEASLDIWEQVSMEAVRRKSIALADFFLDLIDQLDASYGFTVASPRDGNARGSQISLKHPNGLAIMRSLTGKGVIGDFRAPDILRFGFTPLTLSFENVWHAVGILDDIMKSGEWSNASTERGTGAT